MLGDDSPGTSDARLVAGVRAGDRMAARIACDRLFECWERHDPELDTLLDALVGEATAGSETALEVVLTAVHQLGLARPAITRLIIEPVAVDEVAQATLVKLEAKLGSFEGRSKFRTWIYTVARNEALMRIRRDRGEAVVDVEDLDADVARARRMSSVVATRATVRQALAELPEPYRTTILLRVDNDLEYEDIADRLGVPVGTVRSRLAKARSLLAERMSFA